VSPIAGVARAEGQRVVALQLDPRRPAVSLIARPIEDPARRLPLTGKLLAAPSGATAAYVSEAMVALYGAAPGTTLALPLPDGRRADVFVRAVWRDYARQYGAVAVDRADWRRLSGDERVNDLALWLAPGTSTARSAKCYDGSGRRLRPALLEFASRARSASCRCASLRRFAVTYWLQAVAIAIGLFGIAASFSAQVSPDARVRTARPSRADAPPDPRHRRRRRRVADRRRRRARARARHRSERRSRPGRQPAGFHWTMDLLLPWTRLATVLPSSSRGRLRHRSRRGAIRATGGGEGGLVRRLRKGRQSGHEPPPSTADIAFRPGCTPLDRASAPSPVSKPRIGPVQDRMLDSRARTPRTCRLPTNSVR
jgi:putative ABC transport system permease protein